MRNTKCFNSAASSITIAICLFLFCLPLISEGRVGTGVGEEVERVMEGGPSNSLGHIGPSHIFSHL